MKLRAGPWSISPGPGFSQPLSPQLHFFWFNFILREALLIIETRKLISSLEALWESLLASLSEAAANAPSHPISSSGYMPGPISIDCTAMF